MKSFVIGVDFGTDSCRAVLVDAKTGEMRASAVDTFSRWGEGRYCNSQLQEYRQHPLDYLESLESVLISVLSDLTEEEKKGVVAISVDATASTPAPIDGEGRVLALLPEFADDPDAMFVLWKDHSSIVEAEEITALAKKSSEDYTRFCGASYSAEWFWAKILHIARKNTRVLNAAVSWVECSDWIPAVLAGKTHLEELRRNRCAAGHKALWNETFPNGYPPENFFADLDEHLVQVLNTFNGAPVSADTAIGTLSEVWAKKLGLTTSVIISAGIIDAHCGAIGAKIEANTLVKVMGTSTCDMLIAEPSAVNGRVVQGMSGQVNGSILPDYIAFEAGQSAFGDIFGWYARFLLWTQEQTSLKNSEQKISVGDILNHLDKELDSIDIAAQHEYAVDWFNGRRTPDGNQSVRAGIVGLSLDSSPISLYYSLIESAVFGSCAIFNRFEENDIPIKKITATGGIAQKSPFIMQLMADSFNREIAVAKNSQTVALGSAMLAATAAGLYPSIEAAQSALFCGYERVYKPNAQRHRLLKKRMEKYRRLGLFLEEQEKGDCNV